MHALESGPSQWAAKHVPRQLTIVLAILPVSHSSVWSASEQDQGAVGFCQFQFQNADPLPTCDLDIISTSLHPSSWACCMIRSLQKLHHPHEY
jgi:hypothetical protein